MIGKECQLCGGRIVDRRCVECGMYYEEDTGRYYLNRKRPVDARQEVKPETEKQYSRSSGTEKSTDQRSNHIRKKR